MGDKESALRIAARTLDHFVESLGTAENERDAALAEVTRLREALGSLSVVCVVCGLRSDDCTGQDFSEHAHDYAPLVFVSAPSAGTLAALAEGSDVLPTRGAE